MIMIERREGSLNALSKYFNVSHTTLYRWVNKYKEELFERGILSKKRKGRWEYLWVNDIDEFIEFMKSKGVYLVEE